MKTRKGEIMIQLKCRHIDETHALGMRLGECLQPGMVCTLTGDLGVGKTTFTKGIGAGLGINRTINSPTFTIVKQYQGRCPFIHIDAYRMENVEEDLGFDEYFYGEYVTVVEWPEMTQDQLPKERLDITILHLSDHVRTFLFAPKGKQYERICEGLKG